MIVEFEIGEEALYIPLHLNVVFLSGGDFQRKYPDDKIMEKILSNAMQSTKRYIIIDFKNIRSAGYIYDKLDSAFLTGDKVLILYNPSEMLRAKLEEDFADYIENTSSSEAYLSSTAGLDYFKTVLDSKGEFSEEVRKTKIKCVGDVLKAVAKFELQYLESSNIYANKYFNVKSLFANPAAFKIATYEICNIIDDNFHHFDALVCVSNNGAALSAVIGRMLRKPVVYLMNLGPHITIKDIKSINRIKGNDRLIFIYDFICLGTEFKITRMIAKMRGAEVIGGSGVASHLLIPNVHNIPFMNINSDYDFNYSLSVYNSQLEV